MCNKEVHELLIQESHINCIFCNKQIQDPGKPKRYFCCDSMRLIKDDFIVCKNCHYKPQARFSGTATFNVAIFAYF